MSKGATQKAKRKQEREAKLLQKQSLAPIAYDGDRALIASLCGVQYIQTDKGRWEYARKPSPCRSPEEHAPHVQNFLDRVYAEKKALREAK
jgi:hypothetical protein